LTPHVGRIAAGCARVSSAAMSSRLLAYVLFPIAASAVACGGGSTSGAGDAGASASTPHCNVTATGMRGLTTQTLMIGGVARTYLMYLPEALDPSTPSPFVYVFHGAGMSGQAMYGITDYAALADREGVAVVFPDGEGGPGSFSPWNVKNAGQNVCGAGNLVSATGDDFAFMDAMKATVESYQCVDPAHVFVTGFSMGGYFSHHVACYRSDVRAVGPASGGTIPTLAPCTTGHMPMIIFHGTADMLINPGCDDPHGSAVSGFSASATLWAKKNGCAATYKTVAEMGDGGSSGQCYLYDGCPADGQVELCTFNGMGHCWAGGSADAGGAGPGGACSGYASATEIEWGFFRKYAW
jgi:polyhydroxybutyrate depolymerase